MMLFTLANGKAAQTSGPAAQAAFTSNVDASKNKPPLHTLVTFTKIEINVGIRDAGRGLIALAVHRCRLAFEGLIAYVYADQFALIAENLGRVFRKIHTCLVNFRVH